MDGAYAIIFDRQTSRVIVSQKDRPWADAAWPAQNNRASRIQVAICDQQLLVSIDGKQLLRRSYDDEPTAVAPSKSPAANLALTATSGRLQVRKLQVWRDIHYLAPDNLGGTWKSSPLGDSEYLLIGDNVSISVDSRHWQDPAIDRKSIVGQVLRISDRPE